MASKGLFYFLFFLLSLHHVNAAICYVEMFDIAPSGTPHEGEAFRFHPDDLTILDGDTVVFRSHSLTLQSRHNAWKGTAGVANGWKVPSNLGLLSCEESDDRTFLSEDRLGSSGGVIDYFCVPHNGQGMLGKIRMLSSGSRINCFESPSFDFGDCTGEPSPPPSPTPSPSPSPSPGPSPPPSEGDQCASIVDCPVPPTDSGFVSVCEDGRCEFVTLGECGNSVVEVGEECDSVIGCSDDCTAQSGFSCSRLDNICILTDNSLLFGTLTVSTLVIVTVVFLCIPLIRSLF